MMKKNVILLNVAFVLLIFSSLGIAERVCQTGPMNAMVPSASKEDAKLSKEEQQKRAIETFHTIFELSRTKERSANLERMIALYSRIINHYPDVPLAHESYWRLIEIFFRDFNPPKKDEALSLYKAFRDRYPDSPLRNAVEETITRLLYLHRYWNDLLVFVSPSMEDFNDPKGKKSPLPMFYYSEAKFHLHDFKEASKGYQVILKYFPDSRMAITAKERMDDIKKDENKNKNKD